MSHSLLELWAKRLPGTTDGFMRISVSVLDGLCEKDTACALASRHRPDARTFAKSPAPHAAAHFVFRPFVGSIRPVHARCQATSPPHPRYNSHIPRHPPDERPCRGSRLPTGPS